ASAIAETSPGATALERLAAAGRGYVSFALGSPGVFALMFHPERVDATAADYREAGATAFGQLRELVAAAQASGYHPDVPNGRLAAVVGAPAPGPPHLGLRGARQGAGARELEPTLRVMHDVLLGVRPAPAAPPRSTPKTATPPRRRKP